MVLISFYLMIQLPHLPTLLIYPHYLMAHLVSIVQFHKSFNLDAVLTMIIPACATFIILLSLSFKDADQHLRLLLPALREVFDWCELGIQLQVPLYRLREIEVEKLTVKARRLEMLDCWLKGGNERRKSFLKSALEMIGWNVKDRKPMQ